MGSLSECRIEGFICRLCSQIDRNVIHIYTEEGMRDLSVMDFSVAMRLIVVKSKDTLRMWILVNLLSSYPAGLQKKLEEKINVYLKINVSSPSIATFTTTLRTKSNFYFLADTIWSFAQSYLLAMWCKTWATSSIHSTSNPEPEEDSRRTT